MKGWTEQRGVVAKPGRVIWRCDADLCGAQVGVDPDGEDRRGQHDRDFHLLRAEQGGAMDGRDLYLDGQRIGYAYDKIEHYNLRRAYVTHQWIAVLNGRESIKAGPQFRKSMAEFARAIDGAKAWGEGKNPKVWHYLEERR